MTTSNPFIKTLLFLLFLFAIPATALAQVDMAMSASDDPDPVVAGSGASNLVHVLTATNNGPDNATGVFVNVVPLLPAVGVSVESITPSLGSVDPDTLVWTIGDHPAGVSADLTITLTVGPDAAEGTDVISATGTVGADQPDSDESNNTAVDPTSVALAADMAMSASDDPDPVLAGSGTGNLVHVLTATNNGPSDATGVFVDVVPVLPAGVGLDSVTADIGTFDANTLVWTIGNHPVDVSANLTITLTVGYDAAEGTDVISATGTVGADQPDPDESNNTAVDPTSIEEAASSASFFATSIDFTDNNLATVTATITCNSGLPLTQSIDISEGADVNFAIEALSFTTPGVTCEIMIAGTDSAYTVMASANGGGAASSCVFVAGTAAAGEALFDNSRNNSCAFIAVADAAIYTVTKDWVVPDAGNEEMDYDVDVTITCATEILTVDGAAHDGSSTVSLVLGDGDSSYVTVDTSAGASQCSANEDISQSGVESEASEDCTNAVLPAGGSASCTFTNTVFFEGIPTLSQYGLVIMALLMLGVGFVGFRRFS